MTLESFLNHPRNPTGMGFLEESAGEFLAFWVGKLIGENQKGQH
jgi:hypothetical protein